MQNPEVWSFHEPPPTFKTEKFLDTQPTIRHVEQFHFNHLVSVVIPDCLKTPEQLQNVLSIDCEYYKVDQLKFCEIASVEFIENFIRKGKLSLLSINTRIDCDNCYAITPHGKLILSLTKDTYQALGLEGKVSHFTHRNRDRFIINVDLKDGKFSKQKLQKALKRLPEVAVIVSWEPPDNTICPSSIAKYFHQLDYEVRVCEPSFRSHVVYSVKTPILETEPDLEAFTEWMGMACLDGDFSGNMDNYVNSYEPPEGSITLGQVRVLVWRGFYQPNQVLRLLHTLRNMNEMWCAVYVQGFSDAPVIDREEEQGFFTNGDNGNVIIMKNKDFWLCKHRCSAKRYKS
ncbi:hypothetical protein ABEB36_011765 [Hypothenemus hampei]|uniref:Uncharacterized protein n=1 Tax=Hypothenemus hampei TaxID=57062 RepID=A0ABD1E8Y6_HYPHA